MVNEVPELRIVPQALWDKVKRLQAARSQDSGTGERPQHYRNKYLLSGLVRCGICGSRLIAASRKGYGCPTWRNRGSHLCSFRGTPNREVLEAAVLEAVRDYLFCPEAITAAIAAAKETVKRHAPKGKGRTGKQPASDRLAQVEREIENVMAAIRALVEEQLGSGDLAELTDPGYVARAHALLAELVTSITVVPVEAKGGYTCTVTGDLSGVLRIAGDKRAMVSSDGSPGGICTLVTLADPVRMMSLQGRHYAHRGPVDQRSERQRVSASA